MKLSSKQKKWSHTGAPEALCVPGEPLSFNLWWYFYWHAIHVSFKLLCSPLSNMEMQKGIWNCQREMQLAVGFFKSSTGIIHQMNYPSFYTNTVPAPGLGTIQWIRDSLGCVFSPFHACLGAETDAKTKTDISSVDFIYSQQVWFPRGTGSSLENDSPVLQLHGITKHTSSSKLTQSQKLNEVWLIIVSTTFIFSCKHKMLCHSFSDALTSLSSFAVGSSLQVNSSPLSLDPWPLHGLAFFYILEHICKNTFHPS